MIEHPLAGALVRLPHRMPSAMQE